MRWTSTDRRRHVVMADGDLRPIWDRSQRSIASLLRTTALAALLSARILPAHATDVTMAVRTDAESIDPHFHVYTPNSAVARHIFDGLTQVNAKGQIEPALAESWKVLSDDVWEFKLR